MSGGIAPAAFFCLASGVLMGLLFLIFKAFRISFGWGKLTTAVVDIIFCLICGVIIFLCALAVDKGRLRFLQAGSQCIGAWAVIALLDPLVSGFAKAISAVRRKISRLFKQLFAHLLKHLPKREPKHRKTQKKTGFRSKKRKKVLEKIM